MDLRTVRAPQASAVFHSCLHSRLHFWTATFNIPSSEPVLDSPVKLMGWIQAQRTDFLGRTVTLKRGEQPGNLMLQPCPDSLALFVCCSCTREGTWFSWVPASFSHSPPWPGDFSSVLGLEHSGSWCYICCLFPFSLGSPELRDPAQLVSCLIAAVTTLLPKMYSFHSIALPLSPPLMLTYASLPSLLSMQMSCTKSKHAWFLKAVVMGVEVLCKFITLNSIQIYSAMILFYF